MNSYNVGIVGFGGFGQFLRHSWEKLDNITVTAVADKIADRNPGGDINFYNDWAELANDEEIDIVSICTPPSTHAEIACAMMESGKNVLIEKPMATTVDDARKIIATREKTGKVATVNYMIRFNPLMEKIAELAASGVLGKLRHFNLENYAQDEGLPADHWFWDKEVGGGILIEHAVHFIDILHSLTDQKFDRIYGLKHDRNDRQEDQVMAAVHYDGGLIATHYHSFARPGFFEDTSMRLNFDLAEFDIYGWIPLCANIRAISDGEGIKKIQQIPGFKMHNSCSVFDAKDHSRPDGWGNAESDPKGRKKVHAGGIEYEVEEMITASCGIKKPKQAVYADSVRAMICDVIKKIENPKHQLRVKLEDGLSSLKIACKATEISRIDNVKNGEQQ